MLRFKIKKALKKMSKARILIYCTLFLILGISSLSLFKMYALSVSSDLLDYGVSENNYKDSSTVYIDDSESDYNYYMGLNYTEVKSSTTTLTGSSSNKYSDANLVTVNITYDGNNKKGTLKGTVSKNETQYLFKYKKMYAIENINNGYYLKIELLDNPFTALPSLNGTYYSFDGWNINSITDNDGDISGSFISMDSEIYTRYLYIPVDSKNQSDVTVYLNAGWLPAYTCDFDGSNDCSNLKNKGWLSATTYQNQFHGYTDPVTYQYVKVYDNNIQDYDFSDYYESFSFDMNNYTLEAKTQYYNSNFENCSLSGACNGWGTYYIKVGNKYDSYTNNDISDYSTLTFYRYVTRDSNIVVPNGSMNSSNVFSVKANGNSVPYTLTSSYDGSVNTSKTLSGSNSNLTLNSDMTIYNMVFNYNLGFWYLNQITSPSTGGSVIANYYNFKMGRNVTNSNSGDSYNTFRGIYGGNGTNNNSTIKRSKVIIESGIYNYYIAGGTSNNYYKHNIYTVLGSDYDRATNDNTKLRFRWCVMGSYYDYNSKNDDGSPSNTFDVKSGKFGYINDSTNVNSGNTYDAYGLYIGGRGSGGQYNNYVAIQEGGEIARVIGGPEGKNDSGTYAQFYMKGGVAEYVFGGAALNTTYGDRIISLTGGTVVYNVFGGSNGYSGSSEDGKLSGSSIIYVGGNANIGYSGISRDSAYHFYTIPGNLYGAGAGNTRSDKIGSVNSANIIIEGNAHIYGSVYGGGNYGSTGKMDISGTVTNITVNGGTIDDSIYGSSKENGSGIVGQVTIDENASSVVYFRAYDWVNVGSTIPDHMDAVHTSNTADGLDSTATKSFDTYYYDETKIPSGGVTCTTETVGYNSEKNKCIYLADKVPAGSDLSYWKTNGEYAQGFWTYTHIDSSVSNSWNTEWWVQYAPDQQPNVYNIAWHISKDQGESYGNEAHTITLNINGGSIGNIYGGSDTGGTVFANVILNLNGGTVSNSVFGAGKGSATYVSGDVTVNINDGFQAKKVYGGSEFGIVNMADVEYNDTKERSIKVYINGGTVDEVFGGSKGDKDHSPTNYGVVNVYVNDGKNVNTVYGGNDASGTSVKNAYVYVNGGTTNSVYGGSKSAGFDVTNVYLNGGTVGSVYGGSNESGLVTKANVYLLSGSVGNIYGGNNSGGTVTNAYVILNGGTATNAYACGYGTGTVCEKAFILVNGIDSSSTTVYGGGYASKLNSPSSVVVNKGTVGDVYGGNNYSGTVAESNVYINNGTINRVFGGNNAGGSTTTSNVFIGGGTITEVYGGSNGEATSAGTTNVHVYNGTITKLFGGGNQSGATTTNVNVYGGVVNDVFGGSNNNGTVGETNVNIGDESEIEQTDVSLTAFKDSEDSSGGDSGYTEDDSCVITTTKKYTDTLDIASLDNGTYSTSYNNRSSNPIDFMDIVVIDSSKSYTISDDRIYVNTNVSKIRFEFTTESAGTLTFNYSASAVRVFQLKDTSGNLVDSVEPDYSSGTFTLDIPSAGTYYFGTSSSGYYIYDFSITTVIEEKDYSNCNKESEEETVSITSTVNDYYDASLVNDSNMGTFTGDGGYSTQGTLRLIANNSKLTYYSDPFYYIHDEYQTSFTLYDFVSPVEDYKSKFEINVPSGATDYDVTFLVSPPVDSDNNFVKSTPVISSEKSDTYQQVVYNDKEYLTKNKVEYQKSVVFTLSDSDGNVVSTKTYSYEDLRGLWQIEYDELDPGETYYLTASNDALIYGVSASYKITETMVVSSDGPISVTGEGNVVNWKNVGINTVIDWSSSQENNYNHYQYSKVQGEMEISTTNDDGSTKSDADIQAERTELQNEIATYITSVPIYFTYTNPYDFDIDTFTVKFYVKDSYIDLKPYGNTDWSGVNTYHLLMEKAGSNYYRLTNKIRAYSSKRNNSSEYEILSANATNENIDSQGGSFYIFSKVKPIHLDVYADWEQIFSYSPVSDDGSGSSGASTVNKLIDTNFNSTIYTASTLKVTNVYGGNNAGGATSSGNVNLYDKSKTENVYGGGLNAESTSGTVNQYAGINKYVYGGGKNAIVSSDTTVNINGGISQYVYGGGEKGDVYGSSTVNLYNGTVTKSLFGSGNNANTGSSTSLGTSTVNLLGGVVQGDVYGGAYSQVVFGYTNVNVGIATVLGTVKANDHSTSLEVDGNIYGGGQTSSSGSDKMDFTFVSVTKGSTVNLDDDENTEYKVNGSIFGSGNNSVVGDMSNTGAIVNISNLGNSSTVYNINSIQRADKVYLENNYLQILGDVDSTSNIVSARKLTFAYNRINELHMVDNNELYLATGANMLLNMYSEYRDGDDNLVKETVDIDVEKDEDGEIVYNDGVVKSNTVSYSSARNEIYMAKTKVLNVWQTETAQSGAEGNVYGMAFLGMYEYNETTGTVNKGFYDSSYNPKETVDEDDYEDFRYAGTYVYGKHFTSHDITVDGFYTNYVDDSDAKAIRVDYITPTPESSTYYMWTIGVVSSKFEIELNASKYSTLGAAVLPLTSFDDPDAEFWVESVDTSGVAENVTITDKDNVKKVADTVSIANTTFGLSMDTGTSSLNGWKSNSSTDFLQVNKFTGDDKYDADSTNSTPTLSFYLQHSKNVDYTLADNDGDLGYVLIYLESRIPDPDDPTRYDVRNIEITVYMSIIEDGEDGYGSAITPGKKYSVFPSTLTNITHKSSFSIYENLYIDLKDKITTVKATYSESTGKYTCADGYTLDDSDSEAVVCKKLYTKDDLYPTGAFRQLSSKMLFPVGTTITMIDLATNKYYSYTVTSDNIQSKRQQLFAQNEVDYYLSDFTEMSTVTLTTPKNYSDSTHNELYYHKTATQEYAYEEFVFTVDFENVDESVNMNDYIVDNASFYLELMSTQQVNGKNKQIMIPISDDLGNMYYNIFRTDFNGIETTSKFTDSTVYSGQVTTLNVNTQVIKTLGDKTVNNTVYDEYKLGAKITIYDESGNMLDGDTLLGMTLTLGDTKYYPSIDGVFRVRLADAVSTVNSSIGVDIGNANLTTGTYTFNIETFGSPDGIYSKSGEATTVSSDKLYVVNSKFGLDVNVDDDSITHDSTSGTDKNDSSTITYNLKTSSGLANPNLRISLQRRKYNNSDYYLRTYETVDLADYVKDSSVLTSTSLENYYLVENAFYDAAVDGEPVDEIKSKTLDYSIELGENLKSGTYRVVFSVYDGDVYIGENYAYLIIRDM